MNRSLRHVMGVVTLLALASTAHAQTEPSSTPIYDVEVIRHLREADDARVAIEREADTHLKRYETAMSELEKLQNLETLNPEQFESIDALYETVITSLDAVLQSEDQIRSVYRSQTSVLRRALRVSKAAFLNGGAQPNPGHAANAQRIEDRLAAIAHRIEKGQLNEHWRERYTAMFENLLQSKRLFDGSLEQLGAMETSARRDAIAALEVLLTSTYDDYMSRLVGFRLLEAAREQYAYSRGLVADMKTVADLKATIEAIEKDKPKLDLDTFGPNPASNMLLNRIVRSVIGEKEEEPRTSVETKRERDEALASYSKLFEEKRAAETDADPEPQ